MRESASTLRRVYLREDTSDLGSPVDMKHLTVDVGRCVEGEDG
jgi:hypothetical protein